MQRLKTIPKLANNVKKEMSNTEKPSPVEAGMDELFDDAARLVIENNKASVLLLQRKLDIGYGRASRLLDVLRVFGILDNNQNVIMTMYHYNSRKFSITNDT